MASVQRITGVLENGEARAPDVPRHTATTIVVTRFEDAEAIVDVVYPTGVPVDLTPGGDFVEWTARLTIAAKLDPCMKLPTLVVAGVLVRPEGKNRLSFSMPAETFRQLTPGRYMFDVTLDADGEHHTVVRVSTLILEAGLSRA
jgi:hypothetical protein